MSPGLASSVGQRSPEKAPRWPAPRGEVPPSPLRPLPCAPGRATATPGIRRGRPRGPRGLGAAEPAEPVSAGREEDDARPAQVSLRWGPSARSPGRARASRSPASQRGG